MLRINEEGLCLIEGMLALAFTWRLTEHFGSPKQLFDAVHHR
jgi:hypothetical protein